MAYYSDRLLDAQSRLDVKRKRVLKVVIAVLVVVAGFEAQRQQEKYNNDRIKFENELSSKNEEIAQVSRELSRKSEELAKKSDKIADLTREITFISTGGNSFCYVDFLFVVGAPNKPSLVVFHKGKYPLSNVQIVITEMELYKATLPDTPTEKSKARRVTVDDLEKLDRLRVSLDVGLLGPPGAMVELRRGWKLPDRDQVTYSIQMVTQFQRFYQHLKLKKVNGVWTEAYRVHTYGPDHKLHILTEHIPSNFPRGKSGAVNWDFNKKDD